VQAAVKLAKPRIGVCQQYFWRYSGYVLVRLGVVVAASFSMMP